MALKGILQNTGVLIRIVYAYSVMGAKVYILSRNRGRKLIEEIYQQMDPSLGLLPYERIKKIRLYVALCLIAFQLKSLLRGSKLNPTEKRRAVYLGAISALVDDIADDLKLNSKQIRERIAALQSEDPIELHVASILYQKLVNTMESSEQVDALLEQVSIAQDASLKQESKQKLSEEELKKITFEKGGYTVQLTASFLDIKSSQEENEAFMAFGYNVQLIDDMFDLWEDRQSNRQTLYTNSADMCVNAEHFRKNIHQVCTKIMQIKSNPKNLRHFLLFIVSFISRGMVCTDQLLALQEKTGLPFKIDHFPRKDLICDMEKPRNILRSIHYSIKLYNDYSRITPGQ
ncbi:MAG: hypothetical protein GC180_03455 [Bacteroidetes bacterium]|nr:hypothetical protein [Bacteroidota bacterium]